MYREMLTKRIKELCGAVQSYIYLAKNC